MKLRNLEKEKIQRIRWKNLIFIIKIKYKALKNVDCLK